MADMVMKPFVSVVICHHTGELLWEALESLRANKAVIQQVIVVTSDPEFSRKGAEWDAKWPEVEFTFEAGGPAHKRNVGVKLAKSPYVVFLDDDAYVGPYTLWQLFQAIHSRPGTGAVFCTIYNAERRHEYDDCGSWLTQTGFLYARSGDIRPGAVRPIAQRCLASKSACCIVRKTAFRDAGGFDVDYFILAEETELCWRMWLRAWEVWYDPMPTAWHWFNTSRKPTANYYTLERIHFHGAKNYVSMLLTSLGWPKLLVVLPVHLVGWLAAIVGFGLNGQWWRSWHVLRGLAWPVRNWRKVMAKRREVQGRRLKSDREIMGYVWKRVGVRYYLNRLSQYVFRGLHG